MMIKLTLKTASLLLIALFSTSALANSPWAEEIAKDEVEQIEPTPVEEDSRPAMEDEAVESVSTQQIEDEPVELVEEVQQQGDVLDISSSEAQPVAVRVLDFPRRGMSTDKVQNELGRPSEIIPAVGEPPISRWVYDDRTVYFEHSSVIHVVAK